MTDDEDDLEIELDLSELTDEECLSQLLSDKGEPGAVYTSLQDKYYNELIAKDKERKAKLLHDPVGHYYKLKKEGRKITHYKLIKRYQDEYLTWENSTAMIHYSNGDVEYVDYPNYESRIPAGMQPSNAAEDLTRLYDKESDSSLSFED